MARLVRPQGAGSRLVGWMLLALALGTATGCGDDAEIASRPGSPSDDPRDYVVDTNVNYQIEVSEPRWVIPSDGLPADTAAVSNANVEIHFFRGKLLKSFDFEFGFRKWGLFTLHFSDLRPSQAVAEFLLY